MNSTQEPNLTHKRSNPSKNGRQNVKLKEPPLEIDLQPQAHQSQDIENRELLDSMIDECLVKINEMLETVKSNKNLQSYFVKAGTDGSEMTRLMLNLLQDFAIIKQKLKEPDANLGIIGKVMKFLKQILTANNLSKMSQNIDKAIWIVQFESKVICSMEFILASLSIPLDITTKQKECYEQTWKRIKFHKFGNGTKIKDGLIFAKKILSMTTSAVINQSECNWTIFKLISFGLSFPQYYFYNKEGQLKSMKFYRRPTIEMARLIWNLPQNGMIRQFAKLGMRSIKTNIKIFVPLDSTVEPQNILVNNGNSVEVRVLYNQILPLKANQQKQSSLETNNAEQKNSQITEVILHFHGGGFLALSSRSMQTFTRRWSIDLNVPVFSVDYRLPPENIFPTAPNDCFRVYEFLVKSISKYFNINPKKIVIAGDSAGGNLTFATTGIIMKNKLPLPHAIFAAYPANDLQKQFSPSKIYSFKDPFLSPSMLLLCLNEYLGGKKQNETHPLASPIFLTEEFIGGEKGDKRFPLKWPKTRIVVGAQDPLFDDSLKTMERMVSSGVDCECHVYDSLTHGFLNLNFAIPDCEQTIKDSIKHLKDLLA